MIRATSITQLFPQSGQKGATLHIVEHYEVGKLCRVPGYGLEKVEEIEIAKEPLIAIVKFEHYGKIWIVSHLIEIRFERPDYKEKLKERKKKKPER